MPNFGIADETGRDSGASVAPGAQANGPDRDEIVALLAAYQRVVDAGPRTAVAGFFTDDGVFSGIDGDFRGRTAIAEFFGSAGTSADHRRHGGGLHVGSVPAVSVEGSTATAWSTMIYVVPGSPPAVVFAGEYHDRLRRVDGRWLIAERKVVDLNAR